jgi:hypothetical protein
MIPILVKITSARVLRGNNACKVGDDECRLHEL